MFKKQHLALAIAATLAAGSAQAFNAENFTVSGYVKNETAALTKDGTFNGQDTGPTDTTKYNDSGDLIKSESSVKLFINGDVGESSSMHAELLLHNDSKAKGSHFKNSDSYTQSEFLRELYVDTQAGDWDMRLGKQQVVWGTADGAKFMDMINPTDYREMAQNAMAESRIPVWMINAEKYLDNGANVQVVLSQPRENVFAGLNRDINTATRGTSAFSGTNPGQDAGNPFVLLGVDSITGYNNGFLNIAPDIGSVAAGFYGMFKPTVAGSTLSVAAGDSVLPYVTFTTVSQFSDMVAGAGAGTFGAFDGMIPKAGTVADPALSDVLAGYATQGAAINGGAADGNAVLTAFVAGYGYETNLISGDDFVTSGTAQNSAFEYMGNTTFATFNAFANAQSRYKFDMPNDLDSDISLRYKNTTENGLNYSLAYSYAYDKNPVINLSWRGTDGSKLTPTVTTSYFDANGSSVASTSAVGYAYTTHTLSVAGYGGIVQQANGGDGTGVATLEFEQTLERAQNIGAAFDFSLDTEPFGPVVIRAEGVYTKDSRQPVVDLGAFSIGHLTEGLKMEKADKFRYVIGADVTALTDMMVSAQFIQERNLDFVDGTSDYHGLGRYTADFASMHMSNNFKKGIENKEFYSLFLSKPFGASGEGRWNNILMLEEGGGRWNRFDVEYSLSNDLIGSIEYNKYWGDANSQFGQLEAASNVQVGLKYLFE